MVLHIFRMTGEERKAEIAPTTEKGIVGIPRLTFNKKNTRRHIRRVFFIMYVKRSKYSSYYICSPD